jgi:hypothetical protein
LLRISARRHKRQINSAPLRAQIDIIAALVPTPTVSSADRNLSMGSLLNAAMTLSNTIVFSHAEAANSVLEPAYLKFP